MNEREGGREREHEQENCKKKKYLHFSSSAALLKAIHLENKVVTCSLYVDPRLLCLRRQNKQTLI